MLSSLNVVVQNRFVLPCLAVFAGHAGVLAALVRLAGTFAARCAAGHILGFVHVLLPFRPVGLSVILYRVFTIPRNACKSKSFFRLFNNFYTKRATREGGSFLIIPLQIGMPLQRRQSLRSMRCKSSLQFRQLGSLPHIRPPCRYF